MFIYSFRLLKKKHSKSFKHLQQKFSQKTLKLTNNFVVINKISGWLVWGPSTVTGLSLTASCDKNSQPNYKWFWALSRSQKREELGESENIATSVVTQHHVTREWNTCSLSVSAEIILLAGVHTSWRGEYLAETFKQLVVYSLRCGVGVT